MTQDLRAQVEDWLDAMGNTYEEQQDPQATWHLNFTYPKNSGHQMHVAQPEGKDGAIVIASAANLAPQHVKAFNQLADKEKQRFQLRLRRTLTKMEVDFRIPGVDDPTDAPQQFQVEVTRYADGLSLDSFARSVGAVYKTELEASLFIQEELDNRGPTPGGDRFAFERLGT